MESKWSRFGELLSELGWRAVVLDEEMNLEYPQGERDWYAVTYLNSAGDRRYWSSPYTLGQVELFRSRVLAEIAVERLDSRKKEPLVVPVQVEARIEEVPV